MGRLNKVTINGHWIGPPLPPASRHYLETLKKKKKKKKKTKEKTKSLPPPPSPSAGVCVPCVIWRRRRVLAACRTHNDMLRMTVK